MKCVWQSITISSLATLEKAKTEIETIMCTAQYAAFDTETTGLNIRLDKPFLYVCGFVNKEQTTGYTYLVDIERQPKLSTHFITYWQDKVKSVPVYVAHNTKFDLHMVRNIGLPYKASNISDTMFYIRYATDAIPERFGGAPLALKKFAKKYITSEAGNAEKQVKRLQSLEAKRFNILLRERLKETSWKLAQLVDFFKDQVMEYTDLPDDVQQAYIDWKHLDLPVWLAHKVVTVVSGELIAYNKIDRQTVIDYAHLDIVYTLELLMYLDPILQERQNTRGVIIENNLIYPLLRMESMGFKVNVEYIKQCRVELKKYILHRRKRLFDLAGVEFTTGQHAVIKQILQLTFDLEVLSTEATELELLHAQLIIDHNTSGAIEFIETLLELRSLEKWFSVYLMRYLNNIDAHDMIYTSLNQVAAATGRFSSDFQQFPKKAIKTKDGVELFNPRRMFLIPTDEACFLFIDYSQIELRVQGIYTILGGAPDTNLCRAYMPYNCISESGEIFDCTNQEHIRTWNKPWFYMEDPTKPWVPTDIHGVTTTEATGLLPGDDGFDSARGKIGKRVNFAKNYGAQRAKIRTMFPEKTEDEITRINDAYYKAYPGIKHYQEYCYARALDHAYTTNLFGVRYFNATGHKLINLLIQGSSAYLLKLKILAIDKYIRRNNLKSRSMLQIHDELMFLWYYDEEEHIPAIKKIMETWPGTYIPVVADIEYATKIWAEKRNYNGTLDRSS